MVEMPNNIEVKMYVNGKEFDVAAETLINGLVLVEIKRRMKLLLAVGVFADVLLFAHYFADKM